MTQRLFHTHFEWMALLTGLLVMGFMNPYASSGFSFCLFDMLGFPFCPGEGLGHSIAFIFRGEVNSALQSHPLGPAAILILSGRIIYLWRNRLMFSPNTNSRQEMLYGTDD